MTAPRVSPGNRITIWLQSVSFLDGSNERSTDPTSWEQWEYGSTRAADSPFSAVASHPTVGMGGKGGEKSRFSQGLIKFHAAAISK